MRSRKAVFVGFVLQVPLYVRGLIGFIGDAQVVRDLVTEGTWPHDALVGFLKAGNFWIFLAVLGLLLFWWAVDWFPLRLKRSHIAPEEAETINREQPAPPPPPPPPPDPRAEMLARIEAGRANAAIMATVDELLARARNFLNAEKGREGRDLTPAYGFPDTMQTISGVMRDQLGIDEDEARRRVEKAIAAIRADAINLMPDDTWKDGIKKRQWIESNARLAIYEELVNAKRQAVPSAYEINRVLNLGKD